MLTYILAGIVVWALMGFLTFRLWCIRCPMQQNSNGSWKVIGWCDSDDPWYDIDFAVFLSLMVWPLIWIKSVGQAILFSSSSVVFRLFTVGIPKTVSENTKRLK